jgi:hypothetical protein
MFFKSVFNRPMNESFGLAISYHFILFYSTVFISLTDFNDQTASLQTATSDRDILINSLSTLTKFPNANPYFCVILIAVSHCSDAIVFSLAQISAFCTTNPNFSKSCLLTSDNMLLFYNYLFNIFLFFWVNYFILKCYTIAFFDNE